MEGPFACPVCGFFLLATSRDVGHHILRKATVGDTDHGSWLGDRGLTEVSALDEVVRALGYEEQ